MSFMCAGKINAGGASPARCGVGRKRERGGEGEGGEEREREREGRGGHRSHLKREYRLPRTEGQKVQQQELPQQHQEPWRGEREGEEGGRGRETHTHIRDKVRI